MKFILMESLEIFNQIITILILIRVFLSWIPLASNTIIYTIVFKLTEPLLKPIREAIFKSPLGGTNTRIDISPFICFILIRVIINILIRVISIIPF